LRDGDATPLDADKPEVGVAVIFLDDFVREPNKRALDF